ncbi:helix-turn-helix domain-containing protein [Clostridium intestinale]|uniref:XRE family transcriptional regulator n=1 Tax=Clostridium intestinale URNW TaxID=1294142 RepID=U2NN71_9CLOT|nr:helix-turn-helix transcriptional regulator [Clostridium intestinale]ERK30311.1 XRE family transcriptional regulator [Clostridium intestinale URNW]
MKEINIARAIINKRKEKGLTQDDLASYIGVSKASVSKWETEQSYPDITFLPQLAAFFNISIDELMGYEPQMGKEDIRKLYLELSADFAAKPFDEVLGSCREIAKKYFSCFPLLFQIGALLVNNSMGSGDMDKALALIVEAKELFIRVKKESDDAELKQLALNMEAFCSLTLGNPNEVIELLEGRSRKKISTESLLAQAYQITGKPREAKAALQVGIYQYMLSLFGALSDYLMICIDEPEHFDETYRRALDIAEIFNLKKLHPAILVKFYIFVAQGYTLLGNTDRAMDILEEYAELVTGDIYPLQLKGDDYFNLIGEWFEELDLGTALPRNEKIVRQSMVDGVVKNAVFTALTDERRFQRISEKLRNNC